MFMNGYNNPMMAGQPVMMNGMGMMNPNAFPPQTGVCFGQVMAPKQTSSTDEELNIIKSMGGTNFSFDANDSAVAGWDFREGTNLCLEMVDPSTDRVRVKYTGEEFNIIMADQSVVQETLNILKDLVYTTKLLNVSLPRELSKELNIAAGVVLKLLPQAYENGKKNYQTVVEQARRQVASVGYNGGMTGMMYGGQYGMMPNYVVSDQNNAAPMNQMAAQPQMMGQPMVQNPMMAAQPMMGKPVMMNQMGQPVMMMAQPMMGTPTMPVGGTMMGGQNPFVQGGQPQAVPQMNAGPAVPPPGTPQQPATPNPTMGGSAAATTASTTV
jgi:hypothetical protein